MTACEFVDDSRIVCSNRQAAKIYLIQFDFSLKTWSLLDTIDSSPHFTEIIKKKGDTFYVTSYSGGYLTFKVIANKLRNLSFHRVNSLCNFHGVYPRQHDVFLADSRHKDPPGIVTVHSEARTRAYLLPGLEKKRIKDLCQAANGLWIVLASDSGPALLPEKYDSHIALYSFSLPKGFKLKDMISLSDTHLDSVVEQGNMCFVTTQSHILKVRVTNRLCLAERINAKLFPHGVAVKDQFLAYTSYKESSLIISSI